MFSWLKKLLGTNATSATSCTDDTTTASNKSKANVENTDFANKQDLALEKDYEASHKANLISIYNDKPMGTAEEWNVSLIDNSKYALDLKNKIEEVAFNIGDPIPELCMLR